MSRPNTMADRLDFSFEGTDPDFQGEMPPLQGVARAQPEIQTVVIDTRFVDALKLDDLDVGEELLQQYKTGLALLNSVVNDVEIAANQKAQVFSSVNAILAKIVADRTKTMNADRVKALESCLITTLLEFPALKEAFLERYERAIAALE